MSTIWPVGGPFDQWRQGQSMREYIREQGKLGTDWAEVERLSGVTMTDAAKEKVIAFINREAAEAGRTPGDAGAMGWNVTVANAVKGITPYQELATRRAEADRQSMKKNRMAEQTAQAAMEWRAMIARAERRQGAVLKAVEATGGAGAGTMSKTRDEALAMGVYHLGFWSEEKRDQRIAEHLADGKDKRTAHVLTRQEEDRELTRDPGYRRVVEEERIGAVEEDREYNRRAERDSFGGSPEREKDGKNRDGVAQVAEKVAQKIVRDRARPPGRDRSR